MKISDIYPIFISDIHQANPASHHCLHRPTCIFDSEDMYFLE